MGHEINPALAAYEDELLVNAMAGGYGRGGERGARLLKNKNVLELDLTLALPPDEVLARARGVLGPESRLLTPDAADDGAARLVSIVGSGAFSMNPAVVMVTVSGATGGSLVTVRGAAKEGLIKQRAGEKAARRIADAITQGPDSGDDPAGT